MKTCKECGVQPVRQEWATLCFDCDAMRRCPDCGISRVKTREGEKIPCRYCQLQEQQMERSLVNFRGHSRSQIARICPVCEVKLLHGREETCSDKCRKKQSRLGLYRSPRSNGKPKKKKRETELSLSSKDSKKLGEYLSRFEAHARPRYIENDRMKSLEGGRAKVITTDEIRDLRECYPDLLRVLLGISV